MGVLNLEQFMLCRVSGNRSIVNLESIIRESAKPNPVIILEHLRLQTKFYAPYPEVGEMVKNFVSRLRNAGGDVVVWFTSTSLRIGENAVDGRRPAFLKAVDQYYESIYKNKQPPTNWRYLLEHRFDHIVVHNAFAKENVELLSGSRSELLDYMRKINCVAVLAQDSDFLIFENVPRYLSMARLNLEKMTTTESRRSDIKKYFNFDDRQMVLFAVLAGSSCHMHPSMLRNLHDHIMRGVRDEPKYDFVKLDLIGKFVQTLPMEEKHLTEALAVFFDDKVMGLFSNARDYYSMKDITEPVVLPFSLTNSWDNLAIISNLKYFHEGVVTLLPALDDVKAFDYVPTHAVRLMALRKRIYGIFTEKKIIFEHTYEPRDEHTVLEVESVPPKAPNPGLENLWNEDRSLDAMSTRWALFNEALSPDMDVSQLKNLPPKLIIPTAALLYLKNEGSRAGNALNDSELSYLAASMLILNKKLPIELPKKVVISPRSAQVRSLFLESCYLVWYLNFVCGHVVSKEDSCPSHYIHDDLIHSLSKRPRPEIQKVLRAHKEVTIIMDMLKKSQIKPSQ